MSAELAVLGAGQSDITRFAEQVVTGIGFVCAAFILSRALKSQSCQHSSHSFYVRRDRNHSGYGFLGYRFLTEATTSLVITLACLLLGRDHHSSTVDDRGSGNSLTPVDQAHRHNEP